MDQTLINRIVEAALLAAHQPLTLAQLQDLFPDDQPAPADSVEQALEALRDGCAGRGVELVELASGFRFQVQADVHPWVARLWTERQTRYTRATLETLALIAYRQPITRGEIEQVRGVAVNSNIIKALEEREWIRVVGHRDVPGKPELLATTRTFLDYFGLKRLDELPPLSELKDIGELEPQFQFDGALQPGRPMDAGGIAHGGELEASNAEGASDGVAPNSDNGGDGLAFDDSSAEADDGIDTVTDADDGIDTATDVDTNPDPHSDPDLTQHPESTRPAPASNASDEGNPDAAPGERAADVNDPEQDTQAVATTTNAFNGNATETQTESDDATGRSRNDD